MVRVWLLEVGHRCGGVLFLHPLLGHVLSRVRPNLGSARPSGTLSLFILLSQSCKQDDNLMRNNCVRVIFQPLHRRWNLCHRFNRSSFLYHSVALYMVMNSNMLTIVRPFYKTFPPYKICKIEGCTTLFALSIYLRRITVMTNVH